MASSRPFPSKRLSGRFMSHWGRSTILDRRVWASKEWISWSTVHKNCKRKRWGAQTTYLFIVGCCWPPRTEMIRMTPQLRPWWRNCRIILFSILWICLRERIKASSCSNDHWFIAAHCWVIFVLQCEIFVVYWTFMKKNNISRWIWKTYLQATLNKIYAMEWTKFGHSKIKVRLVACLVNFVSFLPQKSRKKILDNTEIWLKAIVEERWLSI